ncbi:MAG: helix-turn-helix protein [Pseudomonadota bacterium]
MRLIAGLSQAEYASLCGVSARALAQVESGQGVASLRTLEKLLKPFGYRMGVVREGPPEGG